jgi:hypothetical protein
LVIDDGERTLEKAYIDACVAAGNVEALFYALQRKRARLSRGGFEGALKAFETKWGEWLRNLELQAGGVFASPPASVGEDAGPVNDGAEGTDFAIDDRNLKP